VRARPEDVRGLGQPMLEAASKRMGRALPRITDASWRALESHLWPGNVRELGNLMERLVIYHAGRAVDVDDLGLPLPLTGHAAPQEMPGSQARPGAAAEAPPGPPSSVTLRSAQPHSGWPIVLPLPEAGTTFDDLERELFAQVLARAEGNQSRAARSLGLSESTLRSRLKRLGLKG
jgi:DNA-binding NtrC family response regulator